MTVLKWVLVIFGVLFLLGAAGLVGVLWWASSIESVHITEADLAAGGSYPPEEKQALLDACNKSHAQKNNSEACTCIADKASTDLSRFLRLILTATLEGNATKVVAVTKGLMSSGVPQDKATALEKEAETRFDGLMQACGLGK